MKVYRRRDYTLRRFTGTITHVSDGDTVDVKIAFGWFGMRKDTLRIRFAGVDTPEMKGMKSSSPENFAEEARQYVIEKVLNKRVTVKIAELKGSGQYITGVHGRVIGVIHPSWFGPSLNVDLVRRGLATVYPKAGCSWMTDGLWRNLLAAQRHAKAKRLKVWNIPKSPRSRAWILILGILSGFLLCGGALFLVKLCQ
jgi:endonuclease YncB( thermonuclease family)